MNDKGLVPNVDHPAQAVAGVEGPCSPGVVLDRTVVKTMLDLLQKSAETFFFFADLIVRSLR